MPKIINAYSGNESVANSLKSLGDSMFGNQSQQALIRENAKAKGAENENAQPFAEAARTGDRNAMAYYGALGRKTGADAANWTLLGTANHAKGIDDPGLATAQLGAHEPMSSTAAGQGRSLANARTIAQMTSDRAAQTQEAIAAREDAGRRWQFEHTPEHVQDENGVVRFQPRSQAMNQPVGVPGETERLANARTINDMTTSRVLAAEKYKHDNTPYVVYDQGVNGPSTVVSQSEAVRGTHQGAPPSKDQIVGGILQSATRTPQQDAQNGAPAAAPAFPTNPDVRSIVGLPTALQSYTHPQTGEVVTSQDNGQTFVDKKGRRGPLAGSGFMPVDHAAALGEARAADQRAAAAAPAPPFPDPAKSAAAADAYKVTGLDAGLQEHANQAAGAIPGVRNILETFGNGEIGAGYERARSSQEIRNNEARLALLAAPGRQSIQAQKWVNELLPEEHTLGFGNPTTEAAKVPKIVSALQFDYANERRLVADINTPPPERQAAIARMHRIENAIRLFTALPEQQQGAAGPQPAQQGAQPAGPVPSATDRNGNKIYFRNGQWGP